MKTIALHDTAGFRIPVRRTTAVRLALGAVLVTILAFAWLESRHAHAVTGRLLPAGTSPVVVLDLSKSTSGAPYAEPVRQTLTALADSGGSAGLVVFSDEAYELMPPGTPTEELRRLIPFFTAIGRGPRGLLYAANPWIGDFTSGTRIGNGLEEARLALARAHVRRGSVILVSDLDDGIGDPASLANSIARLRRSGITLRVIPTFAKPQFLALWKLLAGHSAIISPPKLAPQGTTPAEPSERQTEAPSRSGLPVLLLVLSALLLAFLAANELFSSRLEIRT